MGYFIGASVYLLAPPSVTPSLAAPGKPAQTLVPLKSLSPMLRCYMDGPGVRSGDRGKVEKIGRACRATVSPPAWPAPREEDVFSVGTETAMSETRVLLGKIQALRQRLEQAQGLANEARTAAAALVEETGGGRTATRSPSSASSPRATTTTFGSIAPSVP